MNSKQPIAALGGALFAALCLPAMAETGPDAAALAALDQAYTLEWKEGDEEGVLALFTEDAVVIPHHGDAPVVGRTALREFWFPAGGPPTEVPVFEHRPDEIEIVGDVGVVRGRFDLTWIYEGEKTRLPEGNYLTVAVRTGQGWRIRFLTWNDDPRQWTVTPVEADGE